MTRPIAFLRRAVLSALLALVLFGAGGAGGNVASAEISSYAVAESGKTNVKADLIGFLAPPSSIVGPSGQGIEPGSFAELASAIRAGRTYTSVHSAR